MQGGIVSTIPDLCKRCYSCIRECPAKAIRVVNGQARVISERCIGCGHCVKVCSQNAKQVRNDVAMVVDEILPGNKCIAVVAPSFAASFPETYCKVPTALKKLGFERVVETAFGADLISSLYVEDFQAENDKPVIASSCPAVTNFIQKYYAELVPNIARVVSPMIAIGRYMRKEIGEDIKVVFIGPCIAKKEEIADEEVNGIIDAALTFTELKEIFELKGIDLDELDDSIFDAPHAGMGKVFPLAGGLLKSSELPGDVMEKEILVVEGKGKVKELMGEIANNKINAKFIDILFCEGCINGPAISSDLNYYGRREKIIEFIDESIKHTDKKVLKSDLYNARNLDLRRNFVGKSQRRPMPNQQEIREILASTGKHTEAQELNCGACGYTTCREHAIAVAKGLGEKEMCLPYTIERLEQAFEDLHTTQEQLHSAEKLASIGQLAAGVAHEINNPLGTIMMYASILKRQLKKLETSGHGGEDAELIIKEANRCKNIVANLLDFARQGKLKVTNFDLVALINGIIKKLKVDPRFEGVQLNLRYSDVEMFVDGDVEQLEQVFQNLITNAAEAIDTSAEKEISVSVSEEEQLAVVSVADSGCGIDKEHYNKIFTPFFTTKKMGKGTGLGLAISYGIVKMHKGEITFSSEPGAGTTFTVKIVKQLNINQTESLQRENHVHN